MRVFFKTALLAASLFLVGACVGFGDKFAGLDKGQEDAGYCKADASSVFVPFSKFFVKKDSFMFVTVPSAKEPAMGNFTGLAKVPVKSGTVFTLRLKAMGVEQAHLVFTGLFFDKGAHAETLPLLRHTFLLNVNGMTTIEKDFAVPPGVDSMIINATLWSLKPGEFLRPGANVVIEELSMTEKGMMKTPAADIAGKNFLPSGDFSKSAPGDFKDIHKGNGKNAKHWPDVDAKIVELDGAKLLKIERTPKNYIYPFLTSEKFPFNPQGYFVRATVVARGKGEFNLGLWWARDGFDHDYQNRPKCVLSDEWRTFTETRACLSPLVTRADLSFNSTGDAVIYVKEAKIEVIGLD